MDDIGEITGSDLKKKYEVTIEAEGADGLNTDAGTQVTFVWKRSGKISLSDSAEVWDDGVVYWDSKCTQICTARKDDNGRWASKPSQLLVQSLPTDDEGIPCGIGATIGVATFDLTPYCSQDEEYIDYSTSEPHHVVLPLEPAGSVSLYISTRCLDNEISPAIYTDDTTSSIDEDDVINTGDNLVNECFVHSVEDLIIPCSSFPPSPSALSLVHPDDSTLSLDFEGLQLHSPVNLGDDADAMGLGDVDARNISSPRLPPLLSLIPPDEVVDFSTPVQSTNNTDGVDGNTPSTSQDGVLDCIASSAATTHTNASSTINDALDPSAVENVHALQRRCRRLAKERDEARAEAFAEASVAVQRGIEIENLRRAKDMMLQRLESTEQQLVTMMRLDNDSPSSTATTARQEISNAPSVQQPSGYGSQSEIVQALVEAKVALAQKEFEVMELCGQLRAREAHIQALSEHLAAVKLRAEHDALSPAASLSTKGSGDQQFKNFYNSSHGDNVGSGDAHLHGGGLGGKANSKSPVMLITEPIKAAAEKMSKSIKGAASSAHKAEHNGSNGERGLGFGDARLLQGGVHEETKIPRSNSPVVHIVANASTKQHVVTF